MKNSKKRIRHILCNEDGSIMMYVIIFMVFFLPFAIWIGVNLPVKFEHTYEIKQTTSNMADSMISRIDKESLAQGILWIDSVEANEVAQNMTKVAFNLNGAVDSSSNHLLFESSGNGVLRENIPYYFKSFSSVSELNGYFEVENGKYQLPEEPGVYAYVFNGIPSGQQIEFNDVLPIRKTSVIVRANIPIENGGLLGGRVVIKRTGFSEAEIYSGG